MLKSQAVLLKQLSGILHSLFMRFFYNTLFGSQNHFGKSVLHLVPKQKSERKKMKIT